MNDPDWVHHLQRAKLSQKYPFIAIHVLAPLRDASGVAPVVLQTLDGYLRAPAHTEACFELCLRHLNRLEVPWPAAECITVSTLLANRAAEALKLPNRFVPTADGAVLDVFAHSLPAPPSPSQAAPLPLALHAEWLKSNTAPRTEPASPANSATAPGNAVLCTESAAPRGNTAGDLPVEILARAESAELRANSPTCGNAALHTSPRSAENCVALSMSRRARRRAALKVRKQQKIPRRG